MAASVGETLLKISLSQINVFKSESLNSSSLKAYNVEPRVRSINPKQKLKKVRNECMDVATFSKC